VQEILFWQVCDYLMSKFILEFWLDLT
jgi:hypothetical protein